MRRIGSTIHGFRLFILFGSLLTACQIADAQRGFVSFTRITLDDTMQGGYGVEIADIDTDGLPDIVALSTNPGRFVWYKNPSWERFTITTRTDRNIATAANDIDGDGDVDLVLASEFALNRSTEGGAVHWFENPGNPTENQEWAMHLIDAIPTSHRVKWGDINGDGRKELLDLPIIGVGATAPLYDVNLEFTGYLIPQDPTREPWTGIVLDNTMQMAHGIRLVDWDHDNRSDILTASFQGVQLFQLGHDGQMISRRQIGAGMSGERPAIGSSEVDMGVLPSGQRFVAAIEPWHGNEVVVYTATADPDALWNREVIEAGFVGGHALLTADLNNDGADEIVAGHRSEPYNLFIYRYDARDAEWNRIDLDAGGIGLAGLAIEDINGDGFKDIVGIGTGTHNVVYYENSGT
ncbi:MAG: VCBS repeat-containing protein [Gammaproteobacteria bacterium]|nr:VCBS repeat-containing protein [Pseudomonadales bacterium]MCP5348188.1 VCBS repeat-containing protein [Pseudomonadales bacterium]